MSTPFLSPQRRFQRGVATLTVSLLLLFVASLAMLYVNRGVLVEQRTSATQMQSSQTLETAEAALEWATGMLNSPFFIGADCRPTNDPTIKTNFRERYVMTKFNDASSPSSNIIPSVVNPTCKINPTDGAMTCSCPISGQATAGSAAQPGFTLAFEQVEQPGKPGTFLEDVVKVTAWACGARSDECRPGNYTSGEGHYQRVTAMLKLGPSPRIPSAPLTCGTSCDISGSFNIVNKDVSTNGILINAGTTINVQGGAVNGMETLEGQPVANAQIANDASLLALSSKDPTCEKSAMFTAYFSMTIEQFRDATTTKRLSCSSASDCKSKLDTAYSQGWRSFYFDTDLQLSGNNTYGTQQSPITIVTPNAIKINGNNVFYGLIFSNNADWNNIGTGSSIIHGAQVTCAAYNTNGNGTLEYDPDALKNMRRMSAPLVRVPGSWRDFILDTDAKK